MSYFAFYFAYKKQVSLLYLFTPDKHPGFYKENDVAVRCDKHFLQKEQAILQLYSEEVITHIFNNSNEKF